MRPDIPHQFVVQIAREEPPCDRCLGGQAAPAAGVTDAVDAPLKGGAEMLAGRDAGGAARQVVPPCPEADAQLGEGIEGGIGGVGGGLEPAGGHAREISDAHSSSGPFR
jgi:hypothetical protein